MQHFRETGRRLAIALAALSLSVWAGAARAGDTPEFELTIKDHRFEPEAIHVPAGVQFKLVVHNTDPTSEEFESYELNRERVIPGDTTANIYIGPLDPGTYPFFGEFNQSTAKGQIIAE